MIASACFLCGALVAGWSVAKAETADEQRDHLTHALLLVALVYLSWLLEVVR